jgi:hypothetical protein
VCGQALYWVETIQARGTTDIMTPLSNAVQSLENHPVNVSTARLCVCWGAMQRCK